MCSRLQLEAHSLMKRLSCLLEMIALGSKVKCEVGAASFGLQGSRVPGEFSNDCYSCFS